jgi:UDP-2,4-diacetamido-2,4,6-trideoxy-beta-L-altropyranose hydrolase
VKPKVSFRTDSSASIGLGHLIRCIAVAKMLKEDFEIFFVTGELPASILYELTANNFKYISTCDLNSFICLLSRHDIVVLDGYQFSLAYQKSLHEKGFHLVCLDDLHDKGFYCDLIINPSPIVRTSDYTALPYTQYALGPDFIMLRPHFLKQATITRQFNSINNVLISFGGSDPGNFTKRTLDIVIKFRQFKRINVVLGSMNSFKTQIESVANIDERIKVFHDLDETEMLAIMLDSELAIVPASGISIEALSAGCMVISGISAQNQRDIYSGFNKLKIFIGAELFEKENLIAAITYAITNPIPSIKVFDGFSGKRILKLFQSLVLKGHIILRQALDKDIDLTYNWANDELIRMYSFNTHKITRKEHEQWFSLKIVDPNCLFLIAELNYIAVGLIRFDIKNNDALISYLVDSHQQNKGYGRIILMEGIKTLFHVQKNFDYEIKTLTGFVMKSNLASVRIFMSLGFTCFEDGDKYVFKKSKNEFNN